MTNSFPKRLKTHFFLYYIIIVLFLFLGWRFLLTVPQAATRNSVIRMLVKGLVQPSENMNLEPFIKKIKINPVSGFSEARQAGLLALAALVDSDGNSLNKQISILLVMPQSFDRDISLLAICRGLSQRGDIVKLASLVDSLLRIDFSPPGGWYVQATTMLISAGRLDEADRLYRRAIDNYPEDVSLRKAYENFLLYYLHDAQAVLAQFEVIAKLEPNPDNLLALAQRYIWVHRYGDADATLEQVRHAYPLYAEQVAYLSAETLSYQGDYVGAVSLLERALQDFPYSISLWEMLSSTFSDQGRPEDALQAAQKSIGLAPTRVYGYYQAASVLLKYQRPAEAMPYLNQVLAHSAQGDRMEVVALIDLGTAYMQIGRDDLALQSFCQAQPLNTWQERVDYVVSSIKQLGGCP
jgi:tetratricopeptide (TPR) repeat protein